jgi:AraC family transcriptional activator of mtrCDE
MARELVGGDIVLLPHGSSHMRHDGGERAPDRTCQGQSPGGWTISENGTQDDHLDMLCGRFFIRPPHDRLIRHYLPTILVVRAMDGRGEEGAVRAARHLSSLVGLMRIESAGDKPGRCAILNALTSALFTLALRAASESDGAPTGLMALAGHPRLAPAISAMLSDPAHSWSLPELANLCSMSRATFMRHFQQKLGHTANELLTDVRMSMAANELKKPSVTTEAVAESVGYRSVAAFRRVFTDKMGMTPGKWRRMVHDNE